MSDILNIYYGKNITYIDVTLLALEFFCNNNIIFIPAGDNTKASVFTDPLLGILKELKVNINGVTIHTISCDLEFSLDISNVNIDEIRHRHHDKQTLAPIILKNIHNKLKIVGGDINHEYTEQIMAVLYIQPDSKVLELGSNIGRNTLVIASLLNNQQNLVTMESDPVSYSILCENRNINGFSFHAENSALSKRKLIQKGWDTIPSESILPGYYPVNTISFDELNNKYGIVFDTIVADCEGALYYMLLDMPEILDNISLIIIENDFRDMNHKNFVDDNLRAHGLKQCFKECGGWGPCYDRFYEVWNK